MMLTPFQEAEIEFMRRTGFITERPVSLWRKDKRERMKGERGPARLNYYLFLETLLTSFRLAFVLRDDKISYPYAEIAKEETDRFWNNNRDLFTRYNGDSFEKDEVMDIICKRLREKEYLENVEKILLQLQKEKN